MDTRDWAEEAHAWFESYHESIVFANSNQHGEEEQQQQQHQQDDVVVSSRFFGNLTVNDALWKRFISHPVLMGGGGANNNNKHNKNSSNNDIDDCCYAKNFLLDWKAHDYDLLEQDRGWQPLLRSLPKVEHYRLLTLIRRNLLKPLHDVSNQTLVSRHQWVLIEGLRWKAGLYQRPDVLYVIQQHYYNDDASEQSSSKKEDYTTAICHTSSLEVCPAKANSGGGRFVVWKGKSPAMPGDVLCQATPFCISLYNVKAPDGTLSACFHCGRQPTSSMMMNNNPAKNLVRDLTFLCPQCRVWSYCCLTCQQESAWLHQRECVHLPKLLDHCCRLEESSSTSGMMMMPAYKALLVLRAALQKQNPKPEIQQQWKQLMELETHWQDHHQQQQQQQQSQNNNGYLYQAQQFSQWMLDNGLFGGGDVTFQELVHIFLAIDINAIGLGDNAAAGLFPGMSSMFNHSCNENVTHSWHGSLGMVQFRAVETIVSPGNGDDGGDARQQECCISYVSELQASTLERTACLATYKFFTCRCPRCQSTDEQGRLNATIEWKECLHALEQEEEATNDGSIKLYRKLVDLSNILFPSYFVTKGWAMEECAHALLQQDSWCHDESIKLLYMAREQYGTCRGFDSPLVERVNQALHSLTMASTSSTSAQPDEYNDNDDDDDKNAELCLTNGGWSNSVLLEIKTYEAPPHTDDWGVLAKRIKEYWSDVNVVQWSGVGVVVTCEDTAASSAGENENNNSHSGSAAADNTNSYRLLDLAYGIQSLVLSCRIDQSIKTREQVAQETEEVFDDIIQHVDLIVASDYIY